jgi:hypothetical protein
LSGAAEVSVDRVTGEIKVHNFLVCRGLRHTGCNQVRLPRHPEGLQSEWFGDFPEQFERRFPPPAFLAVSPTTACRSDCTV